MRSLLIFLFVYACILPSSPSENKVGCGPINKCANEISTLFKTNKGTSNFFANSPSCADVPDLNTKLSTANLCLTLLSHLVAVTPSCPVTPPTFVGSGIVDGPREDETDSKDDFSESARNSHHASENSLGWKGYSFFGAKSEVWLFTFGSVIGISVAGFACVMILPSMCTQCYNHFQQFLVAMAVGTLSGDAILHLIPHSFFSHEDHEKPSNSTVTDGEEGTEELEDSEQKIVMKGVVLLFGLFLLYTIEQLFAIVPAYMAGRKANRAAKNDPARRGRLGSTGSKVRFNTHGHSHDDEDHGHGHSHGENGHSHGHSHGMPASESAYHCSDIGGGRDENEEQKEPLVNFHDHCGASVSSHHYIQPSVAYSTSCEEVVFRLHSHNRLLEQKECQVVTPCPHPLLPETPCGEKPCGTHLEVGRTASFKCAADNATPLPNNVEAEKKDDKYKHGSILHRCHSADNINVYCTPVCLIPSGACNNNVGEAKMANSVSTQLPRIVEPESEKSTPSLAPSPQHNDTKPELKPDMQTAYPVESHVSIVTAMEAGNHIGHGHSHGHSHGHGHGHSHSHFGDVNSRAWMVILADAFHNLVDGMAIGVAFSSSLAGGFSTAIAVAMHELPHELGDFAVLLKEGLSIKRGLMFNALSSVICLIGASFGVAFGSSEDFDQIIFALAAGVFLYVSLVDMLPQISAIDTGPGESIFCHLVIRCSGMLTGTGIMVCVAMLESRIGEFLKALI